ncbi:MAG: DUF3341 domain-containing protein [Chlorobi bacterium]|nr:DUF3341 domain-containing protein [Chlorobiota bacterium]
MKKLIGVYDDDVKMMEAIDKFLERKIPVEDVITPFVIEELFEKLNVRSNIQFLAFLYGVFAVVSILFSLYYTFVIDYPLNIGGKPNVSLTFVILLFVGMVLTVVLLTTATFFHQERLYPWKKLKFFYPGMHDDKMIVFLPEPVVETRKEEAIQIFRETGAIDIQEVEIEDED